MFYSLSLLIIILFTFARFGAAPSRLSGVSTTKLAQTENHCLIIIIIIQFLSLGYTEVTQIGCQLY